jgi:fibronectin type 3 domain-containing protein
MRHDSLIRRRSNALLQLAIASSMIACGGSTQEQTAIGTGTATLSWDAAPAPATGYRVYYGSGSHNYSQALGHGEFVATTTYMVTGLQSGRTYYFAVTTTDASGAESGFSNEASATIP